MSRKHDTQAYILMPVIAGAVTLSASYIAYRVSIPNPVIILAVLMIFFTAVISNVSGAVSGICIILYALYFFSDNHTFVHFNEVNMYKCIIIVLSLVIIYLMVAWMRRRRDHAFQQLMNLNEQLEEKNETLKEASDHDELTGLYNRRGGDEKVLVLTQSQLKKDMYAAAAVIDIDNFKDINDLYGHAAGDQALRTFSDALKKSFENKSVLTRSGGDEFMLFVYGNNSSVIEQDLLAFSARRFSFAFQNRTISFTVSCGYSFYPDITDSTVEPFRQADAALYQAKVQGKHTACRYDGGSLIKEKIHGFPMRNIAENLPVAFMVYTADSTEKILVASNSLLKLCECADFDSFIKYTGGTFRGFIYPEDVEETEKSIRKQIYENQAETDSVYYRIQTKTGNIIQVHDLGRLVHDENLGNLFYVVLYNKELTNTH